MNMDDENFNLRLEQELEELLLADDDADDDNDILGIEQSLETGINSSAYINDYYRKVQSTYEYNNKLEQNNFESYDFDIEDGLQEILQASQAFVGLQMNECDVSDTILAHVEEVIVITSTLDQSGSTFVPENTSVTITSSNSILLSEEDILIIHELIELMVSSVERCAPIYEVEAVGTTTLVNNIINFKTDLVNLEQLTIIINDDIDDQLLQEGNVDQICDSNKEELENNYVLSSSLIWSNHLQTELEYEKEYQKTLLLQQDEILWNENNEIKQLIEKQQSEINNRKKNRQQERDNAIKENAVIAIQCMYKVNKAKLTRKHLYMYEQIRLAFVQAELEQLHLLELKQQEQKLVLKEMQLMGVAETQCRSVWVACKHIELERTCLETITMTAEDQRACNYRDYMRCMSLLQAQYMSLTAQEDIEYDLLVDECEEGGDSYFACEEVYQTSLPSLSLKEEVVLNLNTKAVSTSMSASTTTTTTAKAKALNTIAPEAIVASRSKSSSSITTSQQHRQSWGGLIVSKETIPSTTSTGNCSNNNSDTNQIPSDETTSNIDVSSMKDNVKIVNALTDDDVEIPLDIISHCTTILQFNHNNLLTQDWFTTIVLNTTSQQLQDPCSLAAVISSDTNTTFKANENINNNNNNNNSNNITTKDSEAMQLLDIMFNKRRNDNINYCFQVPILQAGSEWVATANNTNTCTEEVNRSSLSLTHLVITDNQLLKTTQHFVARASPDIIIEDDDNDVEQDISGIVDLETNQLLVSKLDLCVEGLINMRFLKKFLNLRKLVVNVNKIVDFNGIQNMRYLVHLSAKDNRICSLHALIEIHGLKYLYLDTNKISDLSPLNNLKSLCILSVNSNLIAEMPVLQCPKLQRLELYCNRITSVPDTSLLGVPLLTHLDLGSNQIHSISGNAISSCGLLQTLILSQNQLLEVPAPIRLPLLKSLWLNGNKISNLNQWKEERTNTSSLQQQQQQWPLFLPSLTKLFLRDNLITNISSDVMASFPLLAEIDLSFNQIISRRNLAGIQDCRLLSALHVQDNPFTTMPVNNGTTTTTTANNTSSSSSRTALPLVEQVALNTWLLELCPFLDTISNNALNIKKDYHSIKNNLSYYCTEDLIHQYMKTKDWLSNSSINTYDNNHSNHHHSNDYLTYVYTDSRLRDFIHLLKMLQLNQTCFSTKEKITKRDESKPANKKVVNGDSKRINMNNLQNQHNNNNDSASNNDNNNNEKGEIDWETDYIKLLQSQRVQIMSFILSTTTAVAVHNSMHFSSDDKDDSDTVISTEKKFACGIGVYMNFLMNNNNTTTSTINNTTSNANINNNKELFNKISTISDSIQVTGKYFNGNLTNNRKTTTTTNYNNKSISNDKAYINGILRFQSLFRGRKIRNKFEAAFKSIRYEDDELDDMLLFNPEEFNFEEFEDSDYTMMMYQHDDNNTFGIAAATVTATATMSTEETTTMVYGDHIRKRQSRNTASHHNEDPNNHETTASHAWILPTNNISANYNVGGRVEEAEEEPFTRPATSMTTVSTISASSEIPHPDSRERSHHNIYTQQRSPVPSLSYDSMLSSRSVTTKQSNAANVAQEWGITDPKVLATMMRRNQRLKEFTDAKEIREQDRDPTARLNRFLKNAHKNSHNAPHPPPHNNNNTNTTSGNTNNNTSGSFGGKPKTMRAAAATRKHSNKKSMALPAWMLGGTNSGGGCEELLKINNQH